MGSVVLFDKVIRMSDAERQQLRQEEHEALDAERIGKIAAHTGTDLAVAACIVMKHDPNSYQAYRQQNFHRVNA